MQERYHLLKPIGGGGGGQVWLCDDARLPGTLWAIKQMAMPKGRDLEQFRKKFKREAEVLANLRHPDLPLVVDSFEEDGNCYLVMEYLNGRILRSTWRGQVP